MRNAKCGQYKDSFHKGKERCKSNNFLKKEGFQTCRLNVIFSLYNMKVFRNNSGPILVHMLVASSLYTINH